MNECVVLRNCYMYLTVLYLTPLFIVVFNRLLSVAWQPEENRALRLKIDRYALTSIDDPSTYKNVDSSPPSSLTDGQAELFTPFSTLSSYLDEASYVAAGGLQRGDDAYSRNKFNQLASDSLRSNRPVPDTRNTK